MIERATAADLDAIEALEASGFEHAGWSREAWAADLDAPGRLVLVTREEDVRAVASFGVIWETAELLRVVVAPQHRGLGLGRQLVQAGLAWASDQGAERMLLEVEPGNAPARALYDRLGFATIATRHDYYGAGLHALVMERPLAPRASAESAVEPTPAQPRHSERMSA